METLEELEQKFAELTARQAELSRKNEEISNEIREIYNKKYAILLEKAKVLSPFKMLEKVTINEKPFEVSFLEMTYENEVHVSFWPLNKNGSRKKVAWPKHTYIAMDNLNADKYKTVDGYIITR